MSATPGHPALRARIAEALGRFLAENGDAATGRLLGIAGSTVSRRGADLRMWPADELLVLAGRDAALSAAIVGCATGEAQASGHPVAVMGDLIQAISDSGRLTQVIAEAMRDGRCTADEASAILTAIQEQRKREDEHLIPDLLATMRGDR